MKWIEKIGIRCSTPKWPHLFFDLLGFAWAQCYVQMVFPSHKKWQKTQGYPTTCFQLNKRKNLTYVSSTKTTSMQRQRQNNNNINKKFALKVRFAIIFTPMVICHEEVPLEAH
jgi:hypothetical protein